MATAAQAQQIINGVAYDFTSIELVIVAPGVSPTPHAGVKSIEYSHGLEPGEGRGVRAQVSLRSRGKYSADGSMEMYKYEYQQFIQQLGSAGVHGFMEVPFDILVSYVEPTSTVTITDRLVACRIKKAAESPSEDSGILTVKCDLHVMQIIPGSLVNTPLFPVEPSKFLKS